MKLLMISLAVAIAASTVFALVIVIRHHRMSRQTRSPSGSSRKQIPEPSDDDIHEAFAQTFSAIENTQSSYFVTGSAGTGKSTLLSYFARTTRKNCVVLAPTGVAALNVRGQTIHSFFKFPPKLLKPEDISFSREKVDLFKSIDCLVLDEVSMVRADLMDAIDTSLRLHRQDDRPFGGLQLVMFGDLCQLPPVVKGKEERDYFTTTYKTPYLLSSKAYKKLSCSLRLMRKVYRQVDEDFIELLQRLRLNRLTSDDYIKINEKVIGATSETASEEWVTLTTTKKSAQACNSNRIASLKGRLWLYRAIVKGRFNPKDAPAEEELSLKRGARIMMVTNNKGRWVNGTIGTVTKLSEDSVTVKLPSGVHQLTRFKWENLEYRLSSVTGKIEQVSIGFFSQFPLILAWAMTIHKGQGKTFDNVEVDLGSGSFAHGQTYVALSRCRSLRGLKLSRPVEFSDVLFDERIAKFYEEVDRTSEDSGTPPEG